MIIMHVRKRHNVYYYQRRVPKAIQHLFETRAYLRTLKTSDLNTALVRAATIDDEWDRLVDANRPSSLYKKVADETTSFPQHIEDLFAYGTEEEHKELFANLEPVDQIRWRAAQEVLTGRPREVEYTFSLLDGLEALKKVKVLPSKTWSKYAKAIERFGDQPLESIKKPTVAAWLDSMASSLSQSSRKTDLSCLGLIHDHALTRGLISSGDNPFRKHLMGPDDTQSYELMDDDLLYKIMEELTPDDRLLALVGRYTGMRLAEMFTSQIVEVEGVTSFNVGVSKTKAGQRIVPIRDCIRDAVLANKDNWGNPEAFSKRFGRAKKRVLGADNRRSMSFHSLRVSFITYVGRADWTEQQCAWLVGHEEGKGSTMSGQLYFKGYSVAKLKEIVESVPLAKNPQTIAVRG